MFNPLIYSAIGHPVVIAGKGSEACVTHGTLRNIREAYGTARAMVERETLAYSPGLTGAPWHGVMATVTDTVSMDRVYIRTAGGIHHLLTSPAALAYLAGGK